MKSVHSRMIMAFAVMLALGISAFAQGAPSSTVLSQIAAIEQAKRNFSPAQKKMDSTLAFSSAALKSPALASSLGSSLSSVAKSSTGSGSIPR